MGNDESAYAGRLEGRTVRVTGASGGIGAATAAALARAGARVLLHARTDQRAREAVQQLSTRSMPVGSVDPTLGMGGQMAPVAGDLGSLAGVRRLAVRVADLAPAGLHVLVNNAGAAFAQRALSPDGVERAIAVNHLAVAALSAELLDLLRRGADAQGVPSRVVNLSSSMEKRGRPVTDWAYPAGYKQVQAYSDSKLLSLAHTYALARRLEGTGVTVNAADPGAVATRFGSKAGGPLRTMMVMGRPFMAGPDKGARTTVRLAAAPELAGASGGYYSAATLAVSSPASRDVSFGEQVHARTQTLLERARA